jgi:hypothetical protein
MVPVLDPHLGGALRGSAGELSAVVSRVSPWRGGLHHVASFGPPGCFLVLASLAPAALASLWRTGATVLVLQILGVRVQESRRRGWPRRFFSCFPLFGTSFCRSRCWLRPVGLACMSARYGACPPPICGQSPSDPGVRDGWKLRRLQRGSCL